MATGTSSGLLDEQRAQSVFKHAILAAYVMPFAEMTGSKAPGRRVVVLDGFAGRGRYPDGSPASAELILKTSVNTPQALIESVLVEKKRSDFDRLVQVVAEYRARGARSEAFSGDVVQYLSEPGGLRVGLFGKHDGSGDDEVQVDAFNVVAGTDDIVDFIREGAAERRPFADSALTEAIHNAFVELQVAEMEVLQGTEGAPLLQVVTDNESAVFRGLRVAARVLVAVRAARPATDAGRSTAPDGGGASWGGSGAVGGARRVISPLYHRS